MKLYLFVLLLAVSSIVKAQKNTGIKKKPPTCCDIMISDVIQMMDTTTAVINGITVNGTTQKPIGGVEIYIVSKDAEYTITSDSEGQFTFMHIPEGYYTLSAKTKNYCLVTNRKIKLGSGWGIDVTICMKEMQ